MTLGTDPKVRLAMAFGITIKQFTSGTPMTVLDIVEVLVFTAGHAMAQKEAIKSLPPNLRDIKTLRDYAIVALDRGIDEGMIDRSRPQLFVPPPKKEVN